MDDHNIAALKEIDRQRDCDDRVEANNGVPHGLGVRAALKEIDRQRVIVTIAWRRTMASRKMVQALDQEGSMTRPGVTISGSI